MRFGVAFQGTRSLDSIGVNVGVRKCINVVGGAIPGLMLLPASPAHEGLHFLKGNGAIVVGIHCFEDMLLRCLPFLQ